MKNMKIFFKILPVLLVFLTVIAVAEIRDNPDPNSLWEETFTSQKDAVCWKSLMKLTVKDGALSVTPGDDTQKTMIRNVNFNPSYPYFQFEYSLGEESIAYKGLCVIAQDIGSICSTGGG